MKIVSLEAENFKRLRAVFITPAGLVVEIAGKNKQGKTSVLDSIWAAIKSTEAGVEQPIRHGESKARIRLDLGEIIVERRFTESGQQLFVTAADGAKLKSPQSVLDALVGRLSFDPLAFVRMKPAEQYEQVRAMVKLEIDVDKLDALNAGDFDRRTDLNREAKAARARAEAISLPAILIPPEPIDTKALLDKIEAAGQHNAKIEKRKARRAAVATEAEADEQQVRLMTGEIERLRARIDELTRLSEKHAESAKAKRAELAAAEALPAPTDIAAVRAELDRAETTNAAFALREQRTVLAREASDLEKQADALTGQMDKRTQEKHAAIAKAGMPVPGLSFGDKAILLNGVPFSQASGAEQIQASCAIAMAANPKLRVIRIEDGSLLDDDSMAIIRAMAAQADFQFWIERVDMSGEVGVVIENGEVKKVN